MNTLVIDCLNREIKRIQSKTVPYEPTGPNSNSYVYTLLTNCGIPAKAPVYGIGWGTRI